MILIALVPPAQPTICSNMGFQAALEGRLTSWRGCVPSCHPRESSISVRALPAASRRLTAPRRGTQPPHKAAPSPQHQAVSWSGGQQRTTVLP